MEDDLIFFENGRQFLVLDNERIKTKNNATWNIKNSNNGCGTAPGNLVLYIFVQYSLEYSIVDQNLQDSVLYKY